MKHILTNRLSQIATARLGNFEKDIGLVGTQYNTVISVFFVGYILTQVPTNMILNKMRPSVFLPVVMCCWAVVSASTGAVQNYTGAVILRFLLGFVEAPFFRKLAKHHREGKSANLLQLVRSTSSALGTPRRSLPYGSRFCMLPARWLVPSEACLAVPSWAG